MKRNNQKWALLVLVVILFLSCEKKNLYQPEESGLGEVTLDNYFDFNTARLVQLNVAYDSKGKTLFEVYGENPMTKVDGQCVKKSGIEALAKGYTDNDGKYNMKVSLPVSVKEIYIYSPYYNVPKLYKATLNGDKVMAEINYRTAVDITGDMDTRAISNKAISWDRMKQLLGINSRLSDWNNSGTPTGIDKDEFMEPDPVLNNYINTYLPEGVDNRGPFTNAGDITLKKEASKVTFYYLGGTTGAESVFAYYCYPGGATVDQIRQAAKYACLVFPNVAGGVLKSGIAMQLKYIDPAGNVTDKNFPEGTRIGFMLWNNGWKAGNSSNVANDVFYSTGKLNKNGVSCTALMRVVEEENGKVYNVLGYEDWPSGDNDYNDVIFGIKSNPADAIDIPVVPEPEPEYTTVTYTGLLCFEDNWPYQGDYDMNDVVVKYNSAVTLNQNNQVVALIDKFTLLWTGANYGNGFGFEYPFNMEGVTTTISNGGSIQDNVVILFTNAKKELNVEGVSAGDMLNKNPESVAYTVTTKFTVPVSAEGVYPPYNPFVTVMGTATEVHLTNYPTTISATNSFPNGADLSDGIDSWFVCKDGFPFAIHLDARNDNRVLNLNYTKEGVRIDKVYPKFVDWAKSKGTTNTDWYLYPAK